MIVKDYIEGNILNIEKVMDTYDNYVYTIISKSIKNNEDIEEVLSDVFIIFWKNYKRLDENMEIKPYLAGITKKLIYKKYRNFRIENNSYDIDDYENIIYESCDYLDNIENREKMKIISILVDKMKENEKNVFIMFYYQNKKIKEISKELGISNVNVKVILHRLRKFIKKEFKKRGYSYGKSENEK